MLLLPNMCLNSEVARYLSLWKGFNSVQDGPFMDCSRLWWAKKAPLPKICHAYPTMIKVGTVIPYLKKIQKIYESCDTPLEFCLHQHFLTGNQ